MPQRLEMNSSMHLFLPEAQFYWVTYQDLPLTYFVFQTTRTYDNNIGIDLMWVSHIIHYSKQ